MDVVLKKVLIFLICCPYILGKRPYKHQNETIGLYLSLIFGIFLGVGGGVGGCGVNGPKLVFQNT